MTLRILTIILFSCFLFASCSMKKGANDNTDKEAIGSCRVERFGYSGYGDSIFALLHGKIVEPGKTVAGKDTMRLLTGVNVTVEQNGQSASTNDKGEFEIGFEKGIFSLVVSKEGYETLVLTNYVSDPDQVSTTEIILERGKEQRTFEIPKWTR
jgi:hypothetical protein